MPIVDLNTRKLRYFVAVAEDLHFSNAAARLFMAQQALSRQIKELEAELGAKLFERSTRQVMLTPAGELFLKAARSALATLDGAAAAVERSARDLAGTVRLGYVPGAALELTPLILAEFKDRHPDVVVEMREYPASDPSAGLASGESDVAFMRIPQRLTDVETETLIVDPVMAMVSIDHPLADRTAVSVRDLLNDPVTVSNAADEAYCAFWRLDAARDDATPADVVTITSVTEEAQLVATGAAIAVVSAAFERYTPVPGVRFLPITDWPGSEVVVAWHAGERSSIVARFVDVALDVCEREAELVRHLEGLADASGLTTGTL